MTIPFLVEPVTMWRCGFCKTVYDTQDKAHSCAALGWNPIHKPGDIVVDVRACGLLIDDYTKAGVFDHPSSKTGKEPFCSIPGVFPENDPWVFRVSNSLHDRPGIACYWVVGAVTSVWECGGNRSERDKHRVAYHLFTEAGCDCGEDSRYCGWTTLCGHTPVMKPPELLPKGLTERAVKYVGRHSRYLLDTR
jgi:hypothetical protein